MQIVKQNRTENGYELETEEGYVIVTTLKKGMLGANWLLTTDWGETTQSNLLEVESLGNVDPIESTKELIDTLKLLDVDYDPTNLLIS